MQALLLDVADLSVASAQLSSSGPIMVMPAIDRVMAHRAMSLACQRANAQGLMVVLMDTDRLGFVQVVNKAFKVSKSPWFGYLAQDAFAGRDWMDLALKALQQRGAGLLGFNDGKWHGQLASFGLASRDWIQSVYSEDFFFPGYQRHFADVELTLIARQQGAYVYEPNSVLMEVDWDKATSGVNAQDRSLFHARLRQGCGGRVSDARLLELFA